MRTVIDRALILGAFLFLVFAIAQIHQAPVLTTTEGAVSLKTAQLAFTEAARVYLASPDDAETGWTWVEGKQGQLLGAVAVTSPHGDNIIGYNGPTPLLIAIEPEGKILQIVLLENQETPSYVRRMIRAGFLERWRGMDFNKAINAQVDAVSSVTMTSEAVTKTLQHRLSLIDPDGSSPPELTQTSRIDTDLGAKELGVLLVVVFGLGMALLPGRRPKWMRLLQLGFSVTMLGFITQSMFSLAMLGDWARVGQPSGNVVLVGTVALAIIIPLIFRKNFYCYFVCPFGGIQELVYRIFPFKFKPNPKIYKKLRTIRYLLLLGVTLTLLLGWGLDLYSFEPFTAFGLGAVGIPALIIALISLVLSTGLYRPWCALGCTSGALIDSFKGFSKRASATTPKTEPPIESPIGETKIGNGEGGGPSLPDTPSQEEAKR